MNDSERRRAFNKELTAQRRRLNTIRLDTINGLTSTLQEALVKIRQVLGNSPSEFQSFLLPELEAQINAIFQAVANRSSTLVEQSLLDSWETGIQIIDSPLRQAGIGVSVLLPAVDSRQILNIQRFGASKIKGIAAETAAKINTQLGLVVLGAQPVNDALTVITNLVEDGDRERSLKIVRTEMGRAYSSATHQRMHLAAKRLPGLQKQWRKSGKLHARPSHVAADGQIKNINDFFNVGGHLMLHPHDPTAPPGEVINCGCTALPYMAHWEVS